MTDKDSPISISSESFEEIPSTSDTMSDVPEEKTAEHSTDVVKKEEKYEIEEKKVSTVMEDIPPEEEKYKKCFGCRHEVAIDVKECPKCTKYIPSPGECVDLSSVNFRLPFTQDLLPPIALPQNFKLPDKRFATNYPAISGDAVADDHDFQEKAFNSLPLTDEQREQLLKDLNKDALVEKRKNIGASYKKMSSKERKLKLKEIINKQKLKQEK